MKLSIKDFFSKGDQIRRKLWIWSHLLKKSLMENVIFREVKVITEYFLHADTILVFLAPEDIVDKKISVHIFFVWASTQTSDFEFP